MKRIIFTLLVSILSTTGSCKSSEALASGQRNQREFKIEVTKEFSTSANPTLQIDNKYGLIRIIEGTGNAITFKVEIIGKGTTDALAKQYAESAHIDFSQSGDKVSATTVLASLSCNNCSRTVNYTVVAPKGVTMNLTNKYGNIYLENAIKPMKVDLKYGNLEANNLANVTIDLKYGNFTVNVCEDLKIDCGYAKIKINRANRITTDSKYDDFKIGTISDLTMNTKYTKVKIDKLNNSFVCNDFKHCTLDIYDISTQFSRIKINSGYSNIKLALDSRHSFRASLSARYGTIKADKLTFNNVSLRNKERNTEAISGIVGGGNPSATVEITASYGNIVFN